MSSLGTSPVEGFGLFTRLASLSSIPTRVGWRRPSRLTRMATTFLTRGPMVSIWSLRLQRPMISHKDMFLSTQVLHAITYHPSRTLVQVKSSSCLRIQNIRNSRLCQELMLEEGRFILTASLAMIRYDSDQARHTNALTISNKCNPISLPIFYLAPCLFYSTGLIPMPMDTFTWSTYRMSRSTRAKRLLRTSTQLTMANFSGTKTITWSVPDTLLLRASSTSL
jgi:hypothetical protein